MASQNDKIDLSQPKNQLSAIAEAERAKLFPKNDYSPLSEKYSSTHSDAIADGDNLGRGTGKFLDIFDESAGTRQDIIERKEDIKINNYNSSNPYVKPAE